MFQCHGTRQVEPVRDTRLSRSALLIIVYKQRDYYNVATEDDEYMLRNYRFDRRNARWVHKTQE